MNESLWTRESLKSEKRIEENTRMQNNIGYCACKQTQNVFALLQLLNSYVCLVVL